MVLINVCLSFDKLCVVKGEALMQVSHFGGGMPSAADFQKMRQQKFAKADSDGDGGLSLDEFKAMGKNMPGGKNVSATDDKVSEMFKKIDGDQDGKVTQSELEAAHRKDDGKHMGPPPGMLLQAQEDGAGHGDLDQTLNNILNGNDKNGAAALVQKLQSLYSNLTNPAHTSISSTSITA